MKKVYEGRISGLGLVMFIVGCLGFGLMGADVFLLIIPFLLIWLFNYDLSTYEAKYGHDDSKKVMK